MRDLLAFPLKNGRTNAAVSLATDTVKGRKGQEEVEAGQSTDMQVQRLVAVHPCSAAVVVVSDPVQTGLGTVN